MSLGTGLPHCWLCKYFNKETSVCSRHSITVPIERGYVICKDFSDIKYVDYDKKNTWFVKFRNEKLLNRDAIYIYSENSSFEEYIPFSELKLKSDDSV